MWVKQDRLFSQPNILLVDVILNEIFLSCIFKLFAVSI